jgi:hypothetical protein
MLIASLAVMVPRTLDPVLLQGVQGTEAEVTFVAVVEHEGRNDGVKCASIWGYLFMRTSPSH